MGLGISVPYIYIYIYIYIFHMSYRAQSKVDVHYSCEAKKYSFGTANIATFWYLVVLKIVI